MNEEMGMTNEQYKGMLIDELADQRAILKLAEEEHAEKTVERIKEQIEKINEKLKF